MRIARGAPRARFVCTVRPEDSWVKSIQKKGNDHSGAAYLSERYGLKRPYRNPTALRNAWATHMARESKGVPRLDLSWPDEVLWAALCSQLPPAARGPCAPGGARGIPWPRQNTYDGRASVATCEQLLIGVLVCYVKAKVHLCHLYYSRLTSYNGASSLPRYVVAWKSEVRRSIFQWGIYSR